MLNPTQSIEMQTKGFFVLFDTNASTMFGAQSSPVTTGAYLRQHPDIVEKFSTALVEAIAFSLAPSNRPEVLRTIMRVFDLPDMGAAERGYEDLSNLNRRPYPSIDNLKDVQKIVALYDRRVLDVDVEGLIEDRFVRKLDETGQIDGLYARQ